MFTNGPVVHQEMDPCLKIYRCSDNRVCPIFINNWAFERNGIYNQNQIQFCIHRSSLSEVERDELYSKELSQVEIPIYIWDNVEKIKSVLIQNTKRKVSDQSNLCRFNVRRFTYLKFSETVKVRWMDSQKMLRKIF